MSPHPSRSIGGQNELRQIASMPRDSDGIGAALRRVYDRKAGMPSDFSDLLGRLDRAN